jgi:hypothetical protein
VRDGWEDDEGEGSGKDGDRLGFMGGDGVDGVDGMNWANRYTAARAALKRKKQHEHTLDQTLAQISTLEQQIYSIEAANINRETLAAMEKAGQAMKQIHGKLNIDVVDQTMYVFTSPAPNLPPYMGAVFLQTDY